MSDNVHVAIRVRPLNSKEIQQNQYCAWKVNLQSYIYPVSHDQKPIPNTAGYLFDKVYTTEDGKEIYNDVAKEIVRNSTLCGINGVVMVYGQSSSGKTFTLYADSITSLSSGSVSALADDDGKSSAQAGIVPLAIEDIFDLISSNPEAEFLVRVSFMEIYNEIIKDLLAPENDNLKIHEDVSRNVFVGGLSEEVVSSKQEVFDLMVKGERNRKVGVTNMNERSSRSHTIFRVVVEKKEAEGGIKVSCLNMVDLAGSERVRHTGAEGIRLKEGAHINKSLLTLGTVIGKLSEGSDSHIPFRDSKLTRILQPSLGGNAKTAIICTITPGSTFVEESLTTLKFASRAKIIRNQPMVNEIIKEDEAMIQKYKDEIDQLKQQLKEKVEYDHQEKIARLELMTKSVMNSRAEENASRKTKRRRVTWFPSATIYSGVSEQECDLSRDNNTSGMNESNSQADDSFRRASVKSDSGNARTILSPLNDIAAFTNERKSVLKPATVNNASSQYLNKLATVIGIDAKSGDSPEALTEQIHEKIQTFFAEISQKDSKLVFLLDEVEALRSSYEEIETGAMSMAKENTTLNEDKKVLTSKNDELQRIAESLGRRVSTNNSNKKEYEKLVTSLKEENSSLKNQLDSLQAECGRLKIEKADTAVALSLAESEKENLSEKLQLLSKELSAANKEKQEISDQYNKSLEDNSALKKEMEVLEEQMKLLRCFVEDNSAESKVTEEKIQSMENTISILEKKIASDDDEMFSLKADLQIKTKEYDALKAEAEQFYMRLKDQEANWTEAQRSMIEELQVLRSEHVSHEKELLQHMELIVQERHAKEDFEKKLAIANQELEKSKNSFEELEQANVSQQMELTNLRAECEKVDKMRAEVQRLEKIRSQVIQELSIATENHKLLSEKLSKQAKDHSEEILQLEAERNNLLKSKKEASDEAYKLKAELNKVMTEKENLKASFESKMKMLLTESNELKMTRESAEKEVEQKSSEIDRLNNVIQKFKVEIEKHNGFINDLQDKIKALTTEKSVVEVERNELITKDEESRRVTQSLKTHLKNAHAERSILESKLKSFGNVDQYKSQIEGFEAQLRQTNNDLQNVIAREKALKEELEGEYAKKEAEIRKLVQELEMERNKSSTTMEDYAATTATVKELLSEVEDLQKREVELKKLIHSLETDLSDSNTSLQASTKDCMALKKKLDKVEKQSAKDVDSLKKELKKHLETQEELLNEISGLKAKEEKLLEDYSNLQKQIATPSESQELLDKLRMKYQGLKEDHQSLQRSFVEKLQMFKEIVNNMRQEVLGIKDCRLKTSTLFIKAKYQSLFESNSDLACKLDQLNTQNASLNLKIDELTQENQKLESRRDSLLEDLHAAQKSLEATQQRLGEIQKQKQEFINAQKKRKTGAGNEENADSNKNPPIIPLVVHHERHVRRDSGMLKQAAPVQRRQILKKHDKDGYQECKQQ
ncbi:hypothetical protein MP638_004863 [Amoeboaphelidium occidentale]|nr:hypothetical protein MP638_004863 [Amoeboaphelidium occidentale]